jgi:hypothetical protein
VLELLSAAWDWLGGAQQLVTAIFISVISAGVIAIFRPRVKLNWGSTSSNFHKFKLSEDASEPIVITTEKLFVQNIGRKPASNIELVLSDIPSSYRLWSPREHRSGPLKDGGFSINVPSLAPFELLIVDIIDLDRRGPRLVAVNCPDVVAKNTAYTVQRQYGWKVNALVVYLMTAGLIGSVYLVLTLLLGE